MNLIKSVKTGVSTIYLKGKKYLPEIMLAGGVITGIAALGMTVRATFKMADKLNEIEENGEVDKKEIAKEAVKTYAIPASLAVTSTGLYIASFSKMKARYIGMLGLYNAVSISFESYRNRVINDVGFAKDEEYLYGIEKETIDKIEVDENGKKKKVKEEQEFIKGEVPFLSPYSIIWGPTFSDGSKNWNWDENNNFNYMFLKAKESECNDLFKSRPVPHLFLNEVYDAIGYPHTKEGALVGWCLGNGDNVVDFGLYNNETEKVKRFVKDDKGKIVLDFNVDGVIIDLIDKRRK